MYFVCMRFGRIIGYEHQQSVANNEKPQVNNHIIKIFSVVIFNGFNTYLVLFHRNDNFRTRVVSVYK